MTIKILPKITFRNGGDITPAYEAVVDPKQAVYYLASIIRMSIDAYKEIAHYDISKNYGVTTTLYNIGNERFHAQNKLRENLASIKAGKGLIIPRPNKMGRWVLQNQKWIENAIR